MPSIEKVQRQYDRQQSRRFDIIKIVSVGDAEGLAKDRAVVLAGVGEPTTTGAYREYVTHVYDEASGTVNGHYYPSMGGNAEASLRAAEQDFNKRVRSSGSYSYNERPYYGRGYPSTLPILARIHGGDPDQHFSPHDSYGDETDVERDLL